MAVVLPATLDEIEAAVCTYFRVTAADLRHGRRQSQTYARHVFYYVARLRTRFSLAEIGDQFGMAEAGVSKSIIRMEQRLHDAIIRADIAAVGQIVDGEAVESAGRGHVSSLRERDVA